MSNSPCALHNVSPILQQVIVDDGSELIKYDGAWVNSTGDIFNHVIGTSYNGTTHRLNVTSQPSSMSFEFRGTAFSILGLIVANQTTAGNGGYTYNATCLVDGQNRFNTSSTGLLCGSDDLQDGTHQVTFTAHGSPDNLLMLVIDGVQYTPTTAELKESHPGVLLLDVCDPLIDYMNTASNWSMIRPPDALPNDPTLGFGSESRGVTTNVNNAKLKYEFIGTKIQAMTTLLSLKDGGSTAKKTGNVWVSIDNNPTTLELSSPLDNDTYYNTIVYESDELQPGKHTIEMAYEGGSDTTPLSLSYFVVHPSYGSVSSSSKSHLGPILGGVLGGIGGLVLTLIVVWIGYSRRQRRTERKAWTTIWRNRMGNSDAMEMMSSPRPEKTNA